MNDMHISTGNLDGILAADFLSQSPLNETTPEPTAKITKYTADEWREAYKDSPCERIRLCKTFTLDKETGQLKKGNPGKISSGTYTTHNASLQQLMDGIANLTEQQAVGLGAAEQGKGRIGFKYWKGEIQRAKTNFRYRNQPTFFLIDVDGINLPQSEILEIISGIVPGFADAGRLIVPSSSAGLYSADGKLLKDSSSLHIYCIIKDGTDAPRFMDVLFDRLWLAGHGFYLLSKTPSLLSRSIIDKAVVGAERLIYEAKPRLLDGITQNRPDPLPIEGGMVDTTLTLDLSTDEKETLEIIRQEKKAEIQPTLEAAVSEKVDWIVKERNVTREDAERIVGENQKGLIADTDILYFTGYSEGIPAGQVLDDLEKFDKKTLGEPMDPSYDGGSRSKAQLFANLDKPGREPIIYSQAHGGITYKFTRYESKKAETPQETPWFSKALTDSSVSRFIDHEPPRLDWIFAGTLLSKTTGMLVGPGAAGKSTLSLLMGIAVATGRDILPGIFTPTRAGKVLGVFAEDDETIIHHRLHSMVDLLFPDDPEAIRLLKENMRIVTTTGHDVRFFTQSSGDLQESLFFAEAFKEIKGEEDLRLIILDPASRYHGSEENDNGAGTFLVSLLEQIAQQTGAAVIILHHVGKRAGSDVHGFDLAAAMHQDASRGASGLTNGVRWQCNLFGIPESKTTKLIGRKSEPGQFLALKVSKKNYGPPEPVHFLERFAGGMLLPVDALVKENDPDLDEAIRRLVIDFIFSMEGEQITLKKLLDGKCREWKTENNSITRPAVEQIITSCVLRKELFERPGKNASGRSITYLSTYPEPDSTKDAKKGVKPSYEKDVFREPERTGEREPEINLEPEIEPEVLEPENRRQPEKSDLRFNNTLKTLNKVEPEVLNRRNDHLRFVSPRNCETVEPEIISSYGEALAPSGSTGAIPLISEEGEDYVLF